MSTDSLPTTLLIGGALVGLAILLFFILWVIAIVKSFKGGDTGWGIANILVGTGLVNMIFFFIKGSKGLGFLSIISFLMIIGGSILVSTAAADPEVLEKLEQMGKEFDAAPVAE